MSSVDLQAFVDKFAEIETGPRTLFVYAPLPPSLVASLAKTQKQVAAGGDTQDLDHITLVYIPDAGADRSPEKIDTILASLRKVTDAAKPIQAKVQGWGYFDGAMKGGEPKTALVGLVDAPGLEDLHVALKKALKAKGVAPSSDHIYTAHFTFAYLKQGARVPNLPKLEGSFTISSVKVAADKVYTLPLKGSVGADAAQKAASLTKEAIGQRQVRRILDALPSLKPSQARDALNYGGAAEVERMFSAAPSFAPGSSWRGAHTVQDLQAARRAAQTAATPRARTEARQARDALREWHAPRTEAQLVSGRHTSKDVVDIPVIDKATPTNVRRTEGVVPEEMAYRGGAPGKDYKTYGLEPNAKDPRWFTGEPSVAANHASDPSHTLRAYRTEGVPAERQGPWTQHIGTDPRSSSRSMSPPVNDADALPIYASPRYEKVIDAQAIPDATSVYKPLPTEGRFQRVKGPNVLRAEGLPASTGVEAAKAASLTKEAIGQRQIARISGALEKSIAAAQKPGGRPLPKSYDRLLEIDPTSEAIKKLKVPAVSAPSADHQAYFKELGKMPPRPVVPTELQREFAPHYVTEAERAGELAPLRDYRKKLLTKNPKKKKTRKRMRHWQEEMRDVLPRVSRTHPSAQDAKKLLTSGRHSPSDVVSVRPIEKLAPRDVRGRPGVDPTSVAWKGGEPPAPDLPEGPRWVSGIPEVGASYARAAPSGYAGQHAQHISQNALEALPLKGVPAKAQGPWSRHIAVDPRGKDVSALATTGRSPVGEHPLYEKVIDSTAMPKPVSRYKPLPDTGDGLQFQRVMGPNLLRGEPLPASLGQSAAKSAAAPIDISDYEQRYQTFDPGHDLRHMQSVQQNAEELAQVHAPDQRDLAILAAKLHDVGLNRGRERHEQQGADDVAADERFKVLGDEQHQLLVEAIREHRASRGKPQSMLAKIVSDADRGAAGTSAGELNRAYSYGQTHMPELSDDEQLQRSLSHLKDKFSVGAPGRRTYFPETAARLGEVYDPLIKMHDDQDWESARKMIEQQSAPTEEALKVAAFHGERGAVAHKDTCSGGRGKKTFYSVPHLWDISKDLPTKQVPISELSKTLRKPLWGQLGGGKASPLKSTDAKHRQKVEKADLSFPLIQHPDGWLMDGTHRLLKAHKAGKTHVPVVTLRRDPVEAVVTKTAVVNSDDFNAMDMRGVSPPPAAEEPLPTPEPEEDSSFRDEAVVEALESMMRARMALGPPKSFIPLPWEHASAAPPELPPQAEPLGVEAAKVAYNMDGHAALTDRALDALTAEGIRLTPAQRVRLIQANKEVDRENLKRLDMSKSRSPFHSHAGEEEQSRKLIEDYYRKAQNDNTTEGALDALGIALHTTQDRFSHEKQDVPPGVRGLITHIPLLPRFLGGRHSPDSMEKYPELASEAAGASTDLMRRFMTERQSPLGAVGDRPLQYIAKLDDPAPTPQLQLMPAPAMAGAKMGTVMDMKKLADLLPGGKGDGKSKKLFDPKEFAMGVKVEREHTTDPKKMEEVAADHLTEDKKYYTKLDAAGLADELKTAMAEAVSADQKAKIQEYIRTHRVTDDDKFHRFVEGLGVKPDAAEPIVYQMAHAQAKKL